MRFSSRLGTRQSRRPAKVMRTSRLVQLVAAIGEDALVEVHEVADLVDGTLPVLGRERVHRQPVEAELERAVDGVEQRLLAGGVAFGAGQAALGRPASVAVHDARDVARDPLRIDAFRGHGD